MNEVSHNVSAFNVSQQIAMGSIIADRETCGDAESKTMKNTTEMVSEMERAVTFIQNERLILERLMDENQRLKDTIAEKSEEIENLEATLKQYHDSEQEIPGR